MRHARRERLRPGRRFVELYDPSLPAVHGNRDLLIQLFLNLVKNAAEATTTAIGTIVLDTAYQHGVRVAAPGGRPPGRTCRWCVSGRGQRQGHPR